MFVGLRKLHSNEAIRDINDIKQFGGFVMSEKNNVKNMISQKLLVIVIVPMLLLSAACTIIGYNLIFSALTKEMQYSLRTAAIMTEMSIDSRIPGDYVLTGDSGSGEGFHLMKGSEDITMRYDLVDEAAELTELEYSVIYKDTRIITTIRDYENVRIVGTGLADQVNKKLADSPDGLFYNKTLINRENYFSYYHPIYNSDGSFAGAIEICCPYAPVSAHAWGTVGIITTMIIAVMILLIILIYQHNKSSDNAIEKLLRFTKQASAGNDAVELDAAVLGRDDELGAIGTSVLEMHRSLRDMMDKDALTKLFNRSSASRKLDLIRSHYQNDGKPYSLAIGDIDFFKKVNDTYGHDAGDLVLVTVSNILQKHLKPLGFVARWGGEEFILVFDRMQGKEAEQYLWKILEELRATEIEYSGLIIKVTMSFGVVCAPDLDQDSLVKMADDRLYYAKENGRNRVVSLLPSDIVEGSDYVEETDTPEETVTSEGTEEE